jgi:sugar phosphate permease
LVPTPPAAADERPTSVRHAVLGAACLLAILTYLLRVGFNSVSTEMRTDLGLGQDHWGYLSAAFMVAYGLFEVPWGHLGDRLGVRGPLVWVVLGGSATTAAVALVTFLPPGIGTVLTALLVLRFLFGLFQAGTFPLISRMMADWIPTAERGQAQGLVWMSSRMGGSLAPLLLIPLFQGLGSWQVPLVLVAGLGLVWAAGFWPLYRGHPEETPRVNAAELAIIAAGRGARPAAHGATPWRRMLRSRSVWCLCLMYGGLGFSGNFFLFFLPDYLKTQRGLPPGQAKWLSALPFVFGVFACLAGGALSDWIIRRTGNRRWSRRPVGMAGLALAAVGILATTQVRDVWWLGLLLCITFFGNDLSMGPAWAAATDKGGRYAGTLSGLMNMTASFTGAAAMAIVGQLLKDGYNDLPFVLFAVSYAIGALAWLGVDVTHTLAPDETTDGRV